MQLTELLFIPFPSPKFCICKKCSKLILRLFDNVVTTAIGYVQSNDDHDWVVDKDFDECG